MTKEQKNKPTKIHNMFKIKYTQTQWERFLGKCYDEKDRQKLPSFFEQDNKKRYVLRKNLTAEETQQLAEISKRIELGYSFFQVWKLIAVGIIFVGIAIFLSLYQNKLIENAIEKALSSIFQAKVDVVGVRLNIPKLLFRFRLLTVGDSEEPYKNLFELGLTEVKLNPQALTLGRLVIENVQCEDIRWNTPRKTPGTLPNTKKVQTSPTSSQETKTNKPPAFDFSQISLNISNLIHEQRANLKSETALKNANTELSNTIDQWTKSYEQKNFQIALLSGQASEIQKVQVSSVKTIEEAQKILTQIDSFSKSVSSISGDIKTTAQQFKITYDRAIQNQKTLMSAINEDKLYLQKLISLPITDGKAILQGMLDDFLRQKLGKIYSYGLRAWGYVAKLKSDPSQKPKQQTYSRLKGRNIPYPSDPYPSFLLKNLQSSVETADRRFAARLENISSDPYKWQRPVLFHYNQTEKNQNYTLKVALDVRSNASTPMLAEFSGNGLPFTLDSLGFLKISNIQASMNIGSVIQWDRDKNSGKIKVVLSALKTGWIDSSDFVTKAVSEILNEAKTIDISIAYTTLADGNFQINVRSSLDTLFQKKIGDYIAKTTKEISQRIEKELNAYLQKELANNELLSKNLQGLNEVSVKSLTDITTYEKLIESKRKELQARIDQIKKEQEEALKKKAQEAVQNIPLPKIGK